MQTFCEENAGRTFWWMVKNSDGWFESHVSPRLFPFGILGGGRELYCLQTSSLKHKLAREAKSSFIYDGVDVGGNSQAS